VNKELQTALLTTVNAPYQTHLDSSALAAALNAGEISTGEVNSFFMEVTVPDQLAFAKLHGVREAILIETGTVFANWSGHSHVTRVSARCDCWRALQQALSLKKPPSSDLLNSEYGPFREHSVVCWLG